MTYFGSEHSDYDVHNLDDTINDSNISDTHNSAQGFQQPLMPITEMMNHYMCHYTS